MNNILRTAIILPNYIACADYLHGLIEKIGLEIGRVYSFI